MLTPMVSVDNSSSGIIRKKELENQYRINCHEKKLKKDSLRFNCLFFIIGFLESFL